MVMQEKPKHETHWSTRALGRRFEISHTKVHQILQKHQLKPHLVRTFRGSDDPQFKQKLEDIVGLYLDPPENALVLCLDEKSQIQALQRAQPILALRPAIPERQTHDYQRHGTTTLFAALNVISGNVMEACKDRHRVIRVSQAYRPQMSQGHGTASDRGQRIESQDKSGSRLPGVPPRSIHYPLLTHTFVVAEHDRAVVLRNHDQTNPARQLE